MYEGSACNDPTYLQSLIDHQHETKVTSIEPSPDCELINMEMEHHNQITHHLNWHNQIQAENDTLLPNVSLITPNPTPPDLLNLSQLPRCSNSSNSFSNPTNMDQTSYVSFAIEKHRRQQLNNKYDALRNLIPNPTKGTDRASVVGDAIIYINELKQVAKELTVLVERRTCDKERMEKHKIEDALTLDVKSINTRPSGGGSDDRDRQWYNGILKYMCGVLIILMLFRIFILYLC